MRMNSKSADIVSVHHEKYAGKTNVYAIYVWPHDSERMSVFIFISTNVTPPFSSDLRMKNKNK